MEHQLKMSESARVSAFVSIAVTEARNPENNDYRVPMRSITRIKYRLAQPRCYNFDQ